MPASLTVMRSMYRALRATSFYLAMLPVVACAQRETPAVRGHSLVFQRIDGGASVLATETMQTGSDSNVTVASVGRGDISAFGLPVADQGGISFEQLGDTHPYTNWQSSGTALYSAVASAGGPDRRVRVSTPPNDEVTLAAVVVAGRRVQDFAWKEVLAGDPLTSSKVTTTGPATLVAFWWGDAGVRYDKQAVPSRGFRVLDTVLESGALVQCAVAVKHVAEAGSYDVTWRAYPTQGAQLWIVAVE
jgi:hypothetical protein